MYRKLLFPFIAMLLGFSVATAAANVPDPTKSVVEPCFATCPFGDIPFSVIVKDFAGIGIPGSTVVLDLSTCPAVKFCPNQEVGTTLLTGQKVVRVTNASGTVTFHLRAGGLCTGSLFEIYADGVPLAARAVASTDQDGDLAATAVDRAIVVGKVGGSDAGADFDCDHSVTLGDVATLDSHLNHTCDSSTPTLPRSWGRLKMLYR